MFALARLSRLARQVFLSIGKEDFPVDRHTTWRISDIKKSNWTTLKMKTSTRITRLTTDRQLGLSVWCRQLFILFPFHDVVTSSLSPDGYSCFYHCSFFQLPFSFHLVSLIDFVDYRREMCTLVLVSVLSISPFPWLPTPIMCVVLNHFSLPSCLFDSASHPRSIESSSPFFPYYLCGEVKE